MASCSLNKDPVHCERLDAPLRGGCYSASEMEQPLWSFCLVWKGFSGGLATPKPPSMLGMMGPFSFTGTQGDKNSPCELPMSWLPSLTEATLVLLCSLSSVSVEGWERGHDLADNAETAVVSFSELKAI